ncbi:hypothetical protein CFAM422_008017 [Trichoderma lentiforme]|uniref:Uncharacterized protein n=1 Tax=Trichoderma lentiforme TaxID=1567552 RepID=A0A9P5CD11_9HYPO|nr:hypothetical protein CFAM422_008017 [Trichoderma lentiforme]
MPGIVDGSSFTFNDTEAGDDAFWDAIGAFHALLPGFVDSGSSVLYTCTLALTEFALAPIAMPDAKNLAGTTALMKPFLDNLARIDFQH